jgi:N-acetylmuramic acid 6-phosphate (MurNAc-6-P) etherase
MTNLRPASSKLARRALRIVMSLAGVSEGEAEQLLAACRGRVYEAVALARSLRRRR